MGSHGGVDDVVVDALMCGDGVTQENCVAVDVSDGGAADVDIFLPVGAMDLSLSVDVVDDLLSFLAPSSFPDQVDTDSFDQMEAGILQEHVLSTYSDPHLNSSYSDAVVALLTPTLAPKPSPSHSFNLSKAPFSYSEATARSDAPVWQAEMDREKKSLDDMGAFEETDLPPGEKAIGLKWVFAHKTDAAGLVIQGKEKGCVVAQGCNQRPGQYNETYAPVAKMASVLILLAWAATCNLDIYQFDCKTAFLHVKLRHPLYARQIPGYPLSNPKKVLHILVALYGLRQSAYEFYMLFLSLLRSLGMVQCEVDHSVFFGAWTSPPDPSVTMPADNSPLVLYVPLHVDDGLAITNLPSLYKWFLQTLSKRLLIVDLGECSKFLGILIIRDRANHRLWLSSHVYIADLLEEWNLSSCWPASTPFSAKIVDLPPALLNVLPDITDADLVPKYQCLVGCLLYLAIASLPDISYYVMWLGQFNANPT